MDINLDCLSNSKLSIDMVLIILYKIGCGRESGSRMYAADIFT